MPKTRTYTFTVSGLTTRYRYNLGRAYLEKRHYTWENAPSSIRFRTQGGRCRTLYYATKSSTSGKKLYRSLKSRYAKVKLKKNEVVYLSFSVAERGRSLKLSIK